MIIFYFGVNLDFVLSKSGLSGFVKFVFSHKVNLITYIVYGFI